MDLILVDRIHVFYYLRVLLQKMPNDHPLNREESYGNILTEITIKNIKYKSISTLLRNAEKWRENTKNVEMKRYKTSTSKPAAI